MSAFIFVKRIFSERDAFKSHTPIRAVILFISQRKDINRFILSKPRVFSHNLSVLLKMEFSQDWYPSPSGT
jgi:hypothetical protein